MPSDDASELLNFKREIKMTDVDSNNTAMNADATQQEIQPPPTTQDATSPLRPPAATTKPSNDKKRFLLPSVALLFLILLFAVIIAALIALDQLSGSNTSAIEKNILSSGSTTHRGEQNEKVVAVQIDNHKRKLTAGTVVR